MHIVLYYDTTQEPLLFTFKNTPTGVLRAPSAPAAAFAVADTLSGFFTVPVSVPFYPEVTRRIFRAAFLAGYQNQALVFNWK